MNKYDFDIKVWNQYREKASKISERIGNCRDQYGNIVLPKKELKLLIDEISAILKQSSNYMDKNGFRMPKPLWKYDEKDTTTHASSPDFKYGHLINNDLLGIV